MREKMEEYLRTHFDVEPKRPSEEALKRWRSAVSIVKNPTRRFRMVADLAKRAEDKRKRKNLQVPFNLSIVIVLIISSIKCCDSRHCVCHIQTNERQLVTLNFMSRSVLALKFFGEIRGIDEMHVLLFYFLCLFSRQEPKISLETKQAFANSYIIILVREQ